SLWYVAGGINKSYRRTSRPGISTGRKQATAGWCLISNCFSAQGVPLMNFQPVINSLIKTLTDIINFIPRLVNGLIVLLIGYIISALVRWILRLIFRSIRLDQLAERAGINNAMSGLGVRASLSEIVAQIVFFFLLLSFATSAISLLGLAA